MSAIGAAQEATAYISNVLPSLPANNAARADLDESSRVPQGSDVGITVVPTAQGNAIDTASFAPFTGPPPPVECIPSLIDNPFSAFPPQSICQ